MPPIILINPTYKSDPCLRQYPIGILAYLLSYQASMVQPLSFNAFILLFTVFVAVTSRPNPLEEDLIAARQFDPTKVLQKRPNMGPGEELDPHPSPWPFHHHHHHSSETKK